MESSYAGSAVDSFKMVNHTKEDVKDDGVPR